MISGSGAAKWWLEQEALALLTRLNRVRPLALQETMVSAAALPPGALTALDQHLVAGQRGLRARIVAYLAWLRGPVGRRAAPTESQRRLRLLRLYFNKMLTHMDIFIDAVTQRSEHETGVWLAGLDVLAADGLTARSGVNDPPPVVCYLDRGHGAAIRRARTRLPGGGYNPVALIRVPRERMVGTGVGSSLIHEVGHQAAAQLDLVTGLREVLQRRQSGSGASDTWLWWERWISEIVADLWSVSHLGIGATLGLISVVSLPRAFVFRVGTDDPHPIPWIRPKLSCAMGHALYPDTQWAALSEIWETYYPLTGLPDEQRQLFRRLEGDMPAFVRLLLDHRPRSLGRRRLRDALAKPDRTPRRLRARFKVWHKDPSALQRTSPTLVFATLGQARADGVLTPDDEGRLVANILTTWALGRESATGRPPAHPPGAHTATRASAGNTQERMSYHD